MRRAANAILLRQLLLGSAVCVISFATGIILAFTTELNAGLLAPNADIKVTPDQASWIMTYISLGGLVGYAFFSATFEIFGRKITNITTTLIILVGSIMLYIANDVYSVAFARLTLGISIGGTFTSIISLSECISRKRRGYLLVLNKASMTVGSLACHSLGILLTWKQIALFGLLGNVISIVIFIICAESPSFLAKRGQFDKCADTFKWYRGDSSSANEELKELIASQMENLKLTERDEEMSVCKRVMDDLKTKEFQKSLIIVGLSILCITSCGNIFLSNVSVILIESTTNTSLSMHAPIALDCIIISAVCISLVLIKIFHRRTLLFKLGYFSVFLMFMVSFSIVLRSNISCLQNMKWLTPSIILLQTFVANVGLVPVAFVLTGEIFSLHHRGLGSFMSGMIFLFFFNILMKLTPILIHKTGVEGTYFFYGIFLFIFLVVLQIVLAETKDKTCKQIEDDIKGVLTRNSDIYLLRP